MKKTVTGRIAATGIATTGTPFYEDTNSKTAETKEEKENGLPPGTRKFLLVRGVALSENNCSTALNGTTSFYFQRQKKHATGGCSLPESLNGPHRKGGTTFFSNSHKKKHDGRDKKTKEEKEKSPRGRCLTAFDANSDKSIKVLPQLVELIIYSVYSVATIDHGTTMVVQYVV